MMMTFRLQQSPQPRQQRSHSDSTLSPASVTPSAPPDIPGGKIGVVSKPHPTPKLRGTKNVQLPPIPMKGTMEQSCFNFLVNPPTKSKQSEAMTVSSLTPEPMQTHSPSSAYYVQMLSPTSTLMQSAPGCMQMQSPLLMASQEGQVPIQQLQFFPAGEFTSDKPISGLKASPSQDFYRYFIHPNWPMLVVFSLVPWSIVLSGLISVKAYHNLLWTLVQRELKIEKLMDSCDSCDNCPLWVHWYIIAPC